MAKMARLTLLKVLELALICTLVGLHYHSFEALYVYRSMITSGTFVGYLIILVGVIAGIIMDTPVNRRLDLFFSIVGCVLFIVAGVLNIEFFNSLMQSSSLRDTGLAKGAISVIEGALLLLDAVFTFKGES